MNHCFFLQQVQNFGDPFFLVIHEGETLEDIKTRIQKKLRVPDEDFAKVCLSLSDFDNSYRNVNKFVVIYWWLNWIIVK